MANKKVGVAPLPGKTKHFQTHCLTTSVTLCDCPGLVFPALLQSKAELVCNGVLPIDHLRGSMLSAVTLMYHRLSRQQFQDVYGLALSSTASPRAVLQAYATRRGFFQANSGVPDEGRASRLMLKDFTAGRLLYCAPPPHVQSEEEIALFQKREEPVQAEPRPHAAAQQVLVDAAKEQADPLAAIEKRRLEAEKGSMQSRGKKQISRKQQRAIAKAQLKKAQRAQANVV